MSGIPAGAGSLLNKRLGKYEILALLALGGTAEIYLARIGGAAGFEKYVVVKCLHDHLNDDQDFVKMFLDEARLAAHLDHSNIVQTMELGEHEERYYMVMEFLAGLSMAMVVRRVTERLPGGVLPVSLSLNMLAQSCAGLHYAHERVISGRNLGIVHRDISPQNLVVSFEGVVKVVDFGIAKAEQRETKTRSGTIKGKFAYMSPEQCVANNVDRRTDVFALGIIAHELLTGRRLFKRSSPYETYQAVIDCKVPKPSQLNVELDGAIDDLVMKALAKDKENRYPSAEAFGDALQGYLHHRGKGSGPGDVGRFFDQYFNQEIEEHGARMRELIAGRDIAISAGWSADDEKVVETVDIKGGGGNETQDLDTSDLSMSGTNSLSNVLDGMGQTGDRSVDDAFDDDQPEDEDSLPAEHTRIEANPLERLAELDQAPALARTGKTPAPQITKPAPAKTPAPQVAKPAPAKTPAPVARTPMPSLTKPADPALRPPQQAKMPPSGPLPLPPAPMAGPGPVLAPGSSGSIGKFPQLANLPTMIADLDESSNTGSGPQHETVLANAATAMAEPIKVDDARAHRSTAPAQAMLPPKPIVMPLSPRSGPSSRTHDAATPLPEFSSPPQQAQQRTLFDPAGVPAPQMPQGQQPLPPNPYQPPYDYNANNNGYQQQQQQPHQHQPMQQNGYNGQQQQQQQQIDSGVYVQPNPGLMSPVGPQYPQAVDWENAANTPARALPTWLLVTLFVIAIGVALGLTILIARVARG